MISNVHRHHRRKPEQEVHPASPTAGAVYCITGCNRRKCQGGRPLCCLTVFHFTLHPSQVSEDLWALKDVSFEITKGDRVGIIGRNGAGKTTLLKILSRITEPTTGSVRIKGRVASLLEVGTGFHPELTGRENIYLNGGILGMVRAEIRKKFDKIVDFAEIEKFQDTLVKPPS